MKFSDAHQQKISPAAEAAGAYFEYENAAPFLDRPRLCGQHKKPSEVGI